MTRIAVFGVGHVGRALLKSFHRVRGRPRLVLVADAQGVIRGGNLDAGTALHRKDARDYDQPRAEGDVPRLLDEIGPDVHIELTPTDLEHGRPAVPDIHAALERGIAVVTAAKSHQRTRDVLSATLARAHGVPFLDHAATLAGIPATEMVTGLGMEVTRIEGVLNGTTNFMLQRLAEGVTFEDALQEAIARGFAERNYLYDLEGHDVAVKLVGLTRHLTGQVIGAADALLQGLPEAGLTRGIVGVTPELVRDLAARGQKLKLVGEVTRGPQGVTARVGARILPASDPFAQIDGFQNAVKLEGRMNDTRMELFLRGPGAGADETASRVLGNLNHLLEVSTWGRGPVGA